MDEAAERRAAQLREQGAAEDEIPALVAAINRLDDWAAPLPAPADAVRLIGLLAARLPRPSPVRQAIRTRLQDRKALLALWLQIALAQVNLFGAAFWIGSAAAGLVGVLVLAAAPPADAALIARSIGPLLALLTLFQLSRSAWLGTQELEFSCLLSPGRLLLARLVVALAYDAGLGLVLSLVGWAGAGGGANLLMLTLHWLAPLLIVAGSALVLGLWISLRWAAVISYSAWLFLIGWTVFEGQNGPVGVLLGGSEWLVSLIGLALLVTALVFQSAAQPQRYVEHWR